MSLAGKVVGNRKSKRDMIRIRNKFQGALESVNLKEKDLIKILYFINLELAITENLFKDMAFEKEEQMEQAEEVHLGLYKAKETLLKVPYKGETNVRKS